MKVEAVERKHNTCIYPMAKGALLGSAVGFATKYVYPLNADEKSTPAYKSAMEEINLQKKQYNADVQSFLETLKAKPNKSVAEDAYVKMFDGMKEGEEIGVKRYLKAYRSVKKNNPDFVDDFKYLCHQARNIAEISAKKCVKAYNLMTKHLRPTSVFVVGGALIGALISVINNAMRTDVKHS